MKSMIDKFLEHPREQDETYLEHLRHAATCSVLLAFASVVCLVHSLLPFLFKKTATNIAWSVLNRRCKNTSL